MVQATLDMAPALFRQLSEVIWPSLVITRVNLTAELAVDQTRKPAALALDALQGEVAANIFLF